MKILKIPTYWQAEEADAIYQFTGELQAAIWQAYGKDIQLMYEEIKNERREMKDSEFDDEIDF
jgi:hypothetical protein